ncbi:DNA primase [Rivibacter subsaxonicus]|uniref:DNA primase n=1 Tax=Rivibacter subsaxonicus TaxID=457575 RepID=A0A4Q7W063_9BURK|nr:DNA primase [Rivibacter subsaxonicus]RZU02537.1 DNA primase [Rivibacter subsaxonicus]
MIPPGFIQELLARADIVEVVGRHVTLKKSGGDWKGLCPFHGEKTPSFYVVPDKQFYNCFGCGVHGDAIRFLTEFTGATFVEAVEDLAQQLGMQVPEEERSPEERERAKAAKERQQTLTEVLAKAAAHYKAKLKADARAVAYLKGRGLSGEIAARFGLGYAPEGWRGLASVYPRYDDPLLTESGLVIVTGDEGEEQKRYDRFRDRIMFPIRSVQGEVIGFGGRVLDKGEPKYLNSPETPVFSKGRELYGLFEARQALRAKGYCLVVEGYMDVVALAQMGFANAVATLGTACTAEHVQKLLRFTDSIVFSFDGDAAGRRAAARALEAALPHASDTRSFRFLFLPTEHDPDSYIREHGQSGFESYVAQALPLSRQLADLAREGCDLGTAEGRARFVAQAKPLWLQLPDGALKLQVAGELAALAQLPGEELMALFTGVRPGAARSAARGARGGAPRAPRRAPRAAIRGPADNVAWALAGHAEGWLQLSDADHELLSAQPGWHGEFFRWLDREVQEHGAQPWATLRVALAGLEWAAPVLALIDANDPALQPALEDLPVLMNQLQKDRIRAEISPLLGRR